MIQKCVIMIASQLSLCMHNSFFRLNVVNLIQFSSPGGQQLPHQPVIIWYLSLFALLVFLQSFFFARSTRAYGEWHQSKSCNPSKRDYIFASRTVELGKHRAKYNASQLSRMFNLFVLRAHMFECAKLIKPHFLISQSVCINFVNM